MMASPVNTSKNKKSFCGYVWLFVFFSFGDAKESRLWTGYRIKGTCEPARLGHGHDAKVSLACREAALSTRSLNRTIPVHCILSHLIMYFVEFVCWWGSIAPGFLSAISTKRPGNPHPSAVQRQLISPHHSHLSHQTVCEHLWNTWCHNAERNGHLYCN